MLHEGVVQVYADLPREIREAFEAGSFWKAHNLCMMAHKRAADNPMLKITLGTICIRLGRYQDACHWVDTLVNSAFVNMSPKPQKSETTEVVTYIEALSVSITARLRQNWEDNHYIFEVITRKLQAEVQNWHDDQLLTTDTELPNYKVLCELMFT